MQRRTLLQLISIGALSPGFDPLRAADVCIAVNAGPKDPYQLQFFTSEENDLVDALMEMIIPADEHSPGAHEAKVSLFADWMISHDPPDVQQTWRTGLQLINQEALATSRADALAKAAAGEANPGTGLERFFVRLKRMTVDGYYTSEIGLHRDLQYRGNEHLLSFPGCDHPEHKA